MALTQDQFLTKYSAEWFVSTPDGRKWQAVRGTSGEYKFIEVVSTPSSRNGPSSQLGQGSQTNQSSPAQPASQGSSGIVINGHTLQTPGRLLSNLLLQDQDKEVPSSEYKQYKQEVDNVFKAQLQSIMTDNMFDRFVKNRQRGKIDMKNLWRVSTGATNVFTQKQSRKGKEYNVVLDIDESGSMRNRNKIGYAADIAVFLAKHLVGINVNLAIVGYNTVTRVHKDFDKKLPDLSKLRHVITHNTGSSYGGGDTDCYDGLALSYNLLRGRTGQNIVIVLADGSPNGSSSVDYAMRHPNEPKEKFRDSDDTLHTFWYDESTRMSSTERNQIKNIHALVKNNEQLATTFGIGIFDNCKQIPNHIREDKLDKLKIRVLETLRSRIRRGV